MNDTPDIITPELLLRAYAIGVFPMAESREDPQIHWIDPKRRGILPLDAMHVSRSLARRMRRENWTVSADTQFRAVVEACADRDETWISEPILALYSQLHAMGFAHSIEIHADGMLIGGCYGVALGGAFFGESMFSRRSDASKAALACLVHRLQAGGFQLLDTQFLTPHLASLGGIEIKRSDYLRRLDAALQHPARFDPEGYSAGSSSPLPSASSLPSSCSGIAVTSGGE